MRPAGRCVGLATAALLVGGCGTSTADGSPDPTGSIPSSAPVAASSSPAPPRFDAGGQESLPSPGGPTFPLTVRRMGGIAGFDDRIVLEASGRVHVDTPSVHGRVCRLASAQQRLLVTLLATLRLDPSATTVPTQPTGEVTAVDPESDPITISITDDQARAIDLSAPSLGEVSALVATLVGDVTLSVPSTTRCTTPTPTPTPTPTTTPTPTGFGAAAASTP